MVGEAPIGARLGVAAGSDADVDSVNRLSVRSLAHLRELHLKLRRRRPTHGGSGCLTHPDALGWSSQM